MSSHRFPIATAAVITAGLGLAIGGSAPAGSLSADPGTLHARALLVDTTGHEVGFATFVEDATGRVHVNVKVSGLAPGLHGIHVHAVGACTPDFAAAGAHHNPLGSPHGGHAGDLPNLVANAAGQGRLNTTTEQVTLSPGPVTAFDANGSALIVHALEDDFVTQPTGNSGGRVACGVIESR